MKPKDKRDPSWDSLKVFLIFLVVFGHFLSDDQGYVERAVHTFIFLFHMPLFAFVSGFFTNVANKEKLIAGTKRIFETFIVWHTIGYFIIGLYFWKLDFTLSTFLTPIWHYWYLLSLVLWRVVAITSDKVFAGKPYLIISLALALSLIVGFFTFIGDILSLSRTFVFSPFFVAGWTLRETTFLSIVRRPRYKVISKAIIILYVVVVLLFPNWGRAIYGDDPYVIAYNSALQGLLMRGAFLISAVLLSLSFINLWCGVTVFAKNGKNTLGVLIYHSWMILLLKHVIGLNLLLSIPVSIIVYCICNELASSNISRKLLNPFSYAKRALDGGGKI